jgi:hypothetical protein
LLVPFRDDGGKMAPFFNGSEPTEATKQGLAFCIQIDFNATRAMIEKIDAHGLFAPRKAQSRWKAAKFSTSPLSR